MFRLKALKHQKTAVFFAGIFASFGFAPIYVVPFFMAAICLCFAFSDKVLTYRKAALLGYLFGFGFFGAGFYWIGNALLIDISTFGWLYPIALLATGAFFGVFWIFPFIIWHAFRTCNVWFRVLGFAAVFVICEYLRSFLLTGFPWNMLGSMFAFSDVLMQSASVVGTYGLSFLLLVLTGAIYAIFAGYKKSGAIVFILILFLMTQFGAWRLAFYERADSELKVRLVQPSIAQSLKWDEEALADNLNSYIDMSRKNGFDDVKMVVWGETATPFNPKDSAYWREVIRRAVPQGGYLITGVLRYDAKEDRLYNSMSVINDSGETLQFYDKNHLVPFGEYIPFRAYLPKWVRPVANQIADFSTGEKYKQFKIKGLPAFGGLICYEIIFPDEVVNRQSKPAFVVLVSNDGWYGKSSGPYQHLVAAQLRAVEEGITVVRSANNGVSAVINPLGQILKKINLNEADTADVYLPQKLSIKTFYAKVGGKGIQYVMLLILAVLFALKNKRGINQ